MASNKHILALIQPGTNSRDIFQDCLAGFEEAGHRVLRLELSPIWQASARLERERDLQGALKGDFTQMLMDLVKANRIDMAIGMWANVPMTFVNPVIDGKAATVFDALGVPLAWWWLDAPHWAHGGVFVQHLRSDITRGHASHHIINNQATAREMRECFAMGRVHAIPYGVNAATFTPREAFTPDHDVVMCLGPGDPAPTEAILRLIEAHQVDWLSARQQLAKELETQVIAGFAGEASVRDLIVELLRSQVPQRHQPIFSRAEELAARSSTLRQGLESLVRNPPLYIKVTDLVRSVERYERGICAARLARRFHFAAFGAGVGDWAQRWRVADKVTDLGTVGGLEQGNAYRRGKVGVNVMRWQDDVGINIKPLEITASRVACVCGRRSGLSELFAVGEEVCEGDTPDEIAGAVERLLHDEGGRARMAQAGWVRSQRDHTWSVRSAQWIEAICGSEAG
jgi:glycosyltransferase involved in cell wall biosynthesis